MNIKRTMIHSPTVNGVNISANGSPSVHELGIWRQLCVSSLFVYYLQTWTMKRQTCKFDYQIHLKMNFILRTNKQAGLIWLTWGISRKLRLQWPLGWCPKNSFLKTIKMFETIFLSAEVRPQTLWVELPYNRHNNHRLLSEAELNWLIDDCMQWEAADRMLRTITVFSTRVAMLPGHAMVCLRPASTIITIRPVLSPPLFTLYRIRSPAYKTGCVKSMVFSLPDVIVKGATARSVS